jgi:hypothetical protein
MCDRTTCLNVGGFFLTPTIPLNTTMLQQLAADAQTSWSTPLDFDYVCPVELALMKRIIIQGAMNHASGADMTKLLTTTAGIQKNAWDISAVMLKTAITPTPKTAAFTMQ